MDHSLASRLESGERQPTRETIAKLCAGLELAQADADEFWIASGFIPPDLCRQAGGATALGVWRALGHAGDARRRAIEGVIAGTLALASGVYADGEG